MSVDERVALLLEKREHPITGANMLVWFHFIPLIRYARNRESLFNAIKQQNSNIPTFMYFMRQLQSILSDIPASILCWIIQYYYDYIEPLKKFRMIIVHDFFLRPGIAYTFMNSDQTFADLDRLLRYKIFVDFAADRYNEFTFDLFKPTNSTTKPCVQATIESHPTHVTSAYTTFHQYESCHSIPHNNVLNLRFIRGQMYKNSFHVLTHGSALFPDDSVKVTVKCCIYHKLRIIILTPTQISILNKLDPLLYRETSRTISKIGPAQLCSEFNVYIENILIPLGLDLAFYYS